MISSQFPPLWGGVGNVAYGEVVHLAARGHEVHVITRQHPPDKKVPNIEGDVHFHHVPMVKIPMAFTTSFGKNAVGKLMQLGNDFDMVHVQSNMSLLQKDHYWDIKAPIVSGMLGTWKGERSMISWRDVTPSIESANDLAVLYLSPLFDVYEDYALKYSNANVIICTELLEAIRQRGVSNVYGDKRWHMLYAGIDDEALHPRNADPTVLERYGLDPEVPTVLFVGRLAARKGVFDMIDIFRRAHREVPSSQLVVLGSGPQERGLRKRVADHGLDDVVTITGSVPFPDLQAFYATAQAVLFPSFWEGQGLIVGEAMASGTVIIASDVGWVPEIIRDGENGFRFPIRDVATAASKLVQVLTDADLRHRMEQEGRTTVEGGLALHHHMDTLEAIYEEVMGDEKPPR
jgi:glycosyltransferase involved in cell wall biosynthesis